MTAAGLVAELQDLLDVVRVQRAALGRCGERVDEIEQQLNLAEVTSAGTSSRSMSPRPVCQRRADR